MKVSGRLKLEVLKRRAAGERLYDMARRAGLHHTTISLLMHDGLRLKPKDRRVLALARVLGVPAREAFEASDDMSSGARRAQQKGNTR